MDKTANIKTKDLNLITEISKRLSKVKDVYNLKLCLVEELISLTNCEGGALFFIDETKVTFLEAAVNIDAPVKEAIKFCINKHASEVFDGDIINIEDISENSKIRCIIDETLSDIKSFPIKSVLTTPFGNRNSVHIRYVILLFNSKNKDNQIVSFDKKFEYLIYIIIYQAMHLFDNIEQISSIKKILNSMVEAFTAVIDERTPYNANHSKNMAKYVAEFLDYINTEFRLGKCDFSFTENDKEQILMAVFLHDIGKLVIPLRIMNKASRLGKEGIEVIFSRFELIKAYLKIDLFSNRITLDTWKKEICFIEEALEFIKMTDIIPELDDEIIKKILEISEKKYLTIDNYSMNYITESEKNNLCIKTGTLSPEDREIMESHVLISERILAKIEFSKEYDRVKEIAAAHHEFLDGSGYPLRLKEDKIPFESQIITVVDIFDSLISDDRPYKNSISISKAFEVLFDMANNGKLSKKIVNLFYQMMTRK